MTKGEQLVRVDFNVLGSGDVANVKNTTANLINLLEEKKDLDQRLAAIAITKYEEAAMWAVKLLTTQK